MSSFSPLSSIYISTVKVDFSKNRPTPEMLNLSVSIYVFFKTCWGRFTFFTDIYIYESPHDKTNKMAVRPAKTQIIWPSAQSDQSLRCPHEESMGP